MNEDRKETDITVEIGDQQEEYKEWLVFAKTDYESAKYLNGAPFHPRPLNVICYHCQQAAEKAVKALIVYYSMGGKTGTAQKLPRDAGSRREKGSLLRKASWILQSLYPNMGLPHVIRTKSKSTKIALRRL